MERKDAAPMYELVNEYIKEMKLSAGLDRQRIFEAWDVVSGAGRYTVDRFYRDGVLYCTIGSSVVRNRLYFQRDVLLKQMNERLAEDEMFSREGRRESVVRSLILK